MTREYGCRSEPRQPTLVGAPTDTLPTPAAASDLRQWAAPVQVQVGSMCVGMAIRDAHCIAVRGAGLRISPRGVYVAARARERWVKQQWLVDHGSVPADAVDAIVLSGVYPEDASDWNISKINDLETWDEAMRCVKFSPDTLSVLPDGDIATVERYLSAGWPVAFSMTVDRSYEDAYGTAIWTGPKGPPIGGHMQALVGHDPNSFLVQNSWGTNWGDGGFLRISKEFVAQQCGNLIAMTGGPILVAV